MSFPCQIDEFKKKQAEFPAKSGWHGPPNLCKNDQKPRKFLSMKISHTLTFVIVFILAIICIRQAGVLF